MDSPPTFDPVTRVIAFSVNIAGRTIPCFATEDWLRDSYGAAAVAGGPLQAYLQRRAAIDATALRAWLGSRGAEPVWLKRDQIWRQGSPGSAKPVAERHLV
jgi:hypothetical protein